MKSANCEFTTPSKNNIPSTSVFDNKSLYGNFRLWVKNHPKIEEEKSKVILQGKAAKRTKRAQNTLVERHFFLTENLLFYRKKEDSGKIKGILEFKFSRMYWFASELPEDEVKGASEFIWCLRFVKNARFVDIYFRQLGELQSWVTTLRRLGVVQSGFHERFYAIEKLGEGSFGKVKFYFFLYFFKFSKKRFFIFFKKNSKIKK